MSASRHRATDAIAFELVVALENYDLELDRLVQAWPDDALYAIVNRRIERMKLLGAPLPELAVPWVHFLISHAELVHVLWTCSEQPQAHAELLHCRASHVLAVKALRQRCVRWLAKVPT